MRASSTTSSPMAAISTQWIRPSYEVRVRGPGVGPGPWSWPGINFLWGSPNIANPIQFDKPLVLHIRNDLFGEDVTFGTLVGAADYRHKDPNWESSGLASAFRVQVQNVSGIYATCAQGLESVVGCIIIG